LTLTRAILQGKEITQQGIYMAKEVSPVKHGYLSAAGTTVGETAKGTAKGMLFGAPLAVGLLAGGIAGGIELISTLSASAAALAGTAGTSATVMGVSVGTAATAGSLGTALGILGSGLLATVGVALSWGIPFLAVGALLTYNPVTGPFMMGIGALVGGAFGFSKGTNKVSQEQGAAATLDANISAMQAQAITMQAQAQAQMAAARNTGFAAAGSPMNPASAKINADSAEYAGSINGAQLAAAR
jgi:hypothetical protein